MLVAKRGGEEKEMCFCQCLYMCMCIVWTGRTKGIERRRENNSVSANDITCVCVVLSVVDKERRRSNPGPGSLDLVIMVGASTERQCVKRLPHTITQDGVVSSFSCKECHCNIYHVTR